MKDTVVFNAVGDIWFADHPVTLGHGVASTLKKNGPNSFFRNIKNVLDSADLNFCNLESVISNKGLNQKELTSIEMRGCPDAIKALQDANFNVVNIANNHIMQHGMGAFLDTVSILNSSGSHIVGLDHDNFTNVVPFVVNGIKISVAGFSLHPELYYNGTVPYSFRAEPSDVIEEIKHIRNHTDGFLIVSLHWGEEHFEYPSKKQIDLAHQLVDHGVNVILGHHPHVIQGIEEYNGALIAYSLGNFLFDLWQPATKKSIVLKLIISKSNKFDFEIIPVYSSQKYIIHAAEGETKKILLEKIAVLNSNINKLSKLSEKEYDSLVKENRMANRISGYKYFILNLHRYKLSIILQSILRTVRRRMGDL
ncbi:MAG: hypothetical protein VR64_23425 [Desulfatitalea sp. BRH_c12]|nr:MAG: hypothetical protein VR64_23425 [Desulfatitalea sp. BRH_c12]